jgi:thiol:disulfide interchange protein DsbD
MSGVLATIVATPCTGPFLGTAVGIATTLPSILALLVFTSLALGMAAPYLLISAFPSLLRFMPKPGNWMVTFKEITGFLMMATVLWLIWVFNSQTNSLALILMLAALLLFAVGSWIFGKWGTPVKTKKVRWIGYAAAAVFFVLGSYTIVEANAFGTPDNEEIAMADSTSSHSWEKFTPARVAELRAQGKPVFVDFTAKWCLTCQLNHAVLVGSDVEANFEEHGVVRMKADWTSHDDVISAELRKFGRNSVPLYVYYPADPNAAPVILPQMLTASIVIDTINTSEEVIAEHHDSNR